MATLRSTRSIRVNFWSLLISGFIANLSLTSSHATHLYALKEAENCAGCHKSGRGQRPVLERRCTLDCQGCHIDPAGAGPRNQWGYYYSQDQASIVNLFTPADPLTDTSRFDLHYDGRRILRKTDQGNRSFPMSSEISLRIRPFVNYLHLTYQNILMGRVEDELFRIVREGDRRFRERYSAMIDSLPLNTYIRAYRGTPMYGLKRSNHSLWIRERIGLDQFATTEAVEVGMTPNVPFFRVSKILGDPYLSPGEKQKGTSAHGGLRGVTFAWHLNGSYWKTESDFASVDMNAFGGGFNVFGLLGYSERNTRAVSFEESATPAHHKTVHPSSVITEHTLAWAGTKGLLTGFIWETLDLDQGDRKRESIFIDIHPIPFLHFELWRRKEKGIDTIIDTLAVVHLYADI